MSAFSQLASKMASAKPPHPHVQRRQLPPTPMGRVGGGVTSSEKYGIGSAVTSKKP